LENFLHAERISQEEGEMTDGGVGRLVLHDKNLWLFHVIKLPGWKDAAVVVEVIKGRSDGNRIHTWADK